MTQPPTKVPTTMRLRCLCEAMRMSRLIAVTHPRAESDTYAGDAERYQPTSKSALSDPRGLQGTARLTRPGETIVPAHNRRSGANL